MKKVSITNGFSQMTDNNLDIRAKQIYAAIDGNLNFPNPVPTVAEMQAAIDAFNAAVIDCRTGDRVKIGFKNQLKQDLVSKLHLWADFVLFKSANNSAVAASSGFTLGKIPQPSPPLTKPVNLRVENAINPGQLKYQINSVPFATSYLHEYATDEMLTQDNWQSVASSRTTCIIADLQPGVNYHCRVAAIGTKGQLLYSDMVSRIVA